MTEKSKTKKSLVALIAAALSLGMFTVLPSSAQAAGCSLVAQSWQSGGNVVFRGGRVNCSNNSDTHVLAKRDVSFGPDQVFSNYLIRYGHGTITTRVGGTRGQQYYTETYSDTGAKTQSNRTVFR
ncbi:hypothetical protein PT279_01035 [Bifidobacterium sp. ESL0784]|uniref:hypothetical protein n=1 Tax=Bifidobacterium sp. ESL0784 TaxID=2983231 RepID=UPI0023F8F2C6|nr:hypothetical protein [Bifidobacterium sp. ESL0784]MDF7640182.1 hypothetical protein [Bifidobacterium sp. ESL0784]